MEDDKIRQKARKLINEKYPHLPFKEWGYFEDMFINGWKQALTIPIVSVSLPSDPMVLAKYLHDNYEQIAKRTKWQTQKNCKVEFDDLPIENKNTMILLAGKLILDFVGNER